MQMHTDRSASITKFSSLFRTTIVWCLTCFGSLLFVGSVCGQSLIVAVSSAQYVTYVEAKGYPVTTYPDISRTTTSPSPISDEIELPNYEYADLFGGPSTDYGIADAGLYGVSSATRTVGNASASSQLLFSPLVDKTQAIVIQFTTSGQWLQNTAATISLSDLTSGLELWSYSIYDNNVLPLVFASGNGVGVLNLDTDFLSSDQYELTMMTSSNAGDDSESVQIQLTGLQAVPEPSTSLLLAMCGTSLMIFRRKRK